MERRNLDIFFALFKTNCPKLKYWEVPQSETKGSIRFKISCLIVSKDVVARLMRVLIFNYVIRFRSLRWLKNAFCQFENSESCSGSNRNNFKKFLRKLWLKILSGRQEGKSFFEKRTLSPVFNFCFLYFGWSWLWRIDKKSEFLKSFGFKSLKKIFSNSKVWKTAVTCQSTCRHSLPCSGKKLIDHIVCSAKAPFVLHTVE